jgi:hypothetical protein
MVEFKKGGYYMPMDRQYYSSEDISPKLEEPIVPISKLGETVPESIGGRNIIQTTQAAIRGGASTLQLVGMRQGTSVVTAPGAIGARYGQEVRQALREVIAAAGPDVNIVGIEMPTSMNNFNGMTQRGFQEQARRETLSQVKEAIQFVADINRGGGVDMVSFEFDRPRSKLSEADQKRFDIHSEEKVFALVDDRTGELSQYRKTKGQMLPYVKTRDGYKSTKELVDAGKKEYADPTTGLPKLNMFTWQDFEDWAKEENTTPEQKYMEVVMQNQIDLSRGQLAIYEQRMNEYKREAEKARRQIQIGRAIEFDEQGTPVGQRPLTNEEKARLEEDEKRLTRLYSESRDSYLGTQQNIEEAKQSVTHLKPVEQFAPEKTALSYAEAGLYAMQESNQLRAQGKLKKELYVGPEIGWPDYYGGHPDEFIGIIRKSRDKMVDFLTKPKVVDEATKQEIKSPYYDPRVSVKEAKELAGKHIAGTFDTGHLAMWYKHFKPDLPDEQRLKEFKKWYMEQVDKIADANVVGGIQVVDSHSGEHGHLPPGEGIFPVIEATKRFQEKGFKGFIVSEGHDEEAFGQGRIRTKLWERMGGKVGQGYFGQPAAWGHISPSYFGKTYSPKFMFGSYVPSNDFRLWSEVPLE